MLLDIFSNVFFVCGTIVTIIFTVVLISMVAYSIFEFVKRLVKKCWKKQSRKDIHCVMMHLA